MPIVQNILHVQGGSAQAAALFDFIADRRYGRGSVDLSWITPMPVSYTHLEDKTQPQPNPEQINEEKLIPQEVPPAAEPEQADSDALALEAFDLINEARAENGLHEVTVNEEAMDCLLYTSRCV